MTHLRFFEDDFHTSQAALCWPSGYNAKTEHHLTISRSGAVSLSGGRDAARVSLADLEVCAPLVYVACLLPRSSFTVLYRRLCSVHTHLSWPPESSCVSLAALEARL